MRFQTSTLVHGVTMCNYKMNKSAKQSAFLSNNVHEFPILPSPDHRKYAQNLTRHLYINKNKRSKHPSFMSGTFRDDDDDG